MTTLPKATTTRAGHPILLRLATPADAENLIAAVDEVARERSFFLRSRFCVSAEHEREFLRRVQEEGSLVLLAELQGSIAGWVTLMRGKQEYRQHVGELGIGVLATYRGAGVGSALIDAALGWAVDARLERVELGVRASNPGALRLYERFGFEAEGFSPRAVKDDLGEYDDIVHMARLL
jgi:RimJ/RimL family protein N-acetyltransferase